MILDLYDEMKGIVSEVTGSQYAIKTLDAIFDKPVFRRSDFIERTEIPRSSAKRVLNDMLEQEILTTRREAKGRQPALLEFDELVQIVDQRNFVANE